MTNCALKTSVVMASTAKWAAGSNYPFIGVRSLYSQYSAEKLQDHLLQIIDFPCSTFASSNQDVITHARYCYERGCQNMLKRMHEIPAISTVKDERRPRKDLRPWN
jgi:hypothetical protein